MTRPVRPVPPLRLVLLALAVAGTGARCAGLEPCILPRNAPLPEVLHLVNRNAALVQSLYTTDARVTGSSQGQPFTIGARFAMEKPRRFRLIARNVLGNEELDLGSNDEQFWYWVARAQPPALYYCRHEQATDAALPLDPNWIIEALGVGELEPAEVYEGPNPVGGGRIELRSHARSPQGEPLTRLTTIDACRGWIVEQTLIDASGRVVAQAALSQHRDDPESGAVLPRRVHLSWPDARLSITLSLSDLRVNEMPVGTDLWMRPSKPQEIDLCNTSLAPLRAPPPSSRRGPTTSGLLPAALLRPKLR